MWDRNVPRGKYVVNIGTNAVISNSQHESVAATMALLE